MKSKSYYFGLFSLVLGILSFIQLMGLERAAVAVYFGVAGLREMYKDENYKGKKFAWTGIILGLGYILAIVFLFLYKGKELFKFL